MNTIAKIVLSSALIWNSFSYAGVTPTVEKPATLSQEISSLLKKCDIKLEQDVSFQVVFVVNRDKEVIVTDVRTENKELKQFIRSRLNYKKLATATTCGKRYFLPVSMHIS